MSAEPRSTDTSTDPASGPPSGEWPAESDSGPALETQGLVRTFGDFTAVDGIDLQVPPGSFYGFLGPNGAGKSTTIKCLTGLLRPSAGAIRILGLDPLAQPVAVKRRVGVVPEDLALFERLTGAENLAFVGRVHGLEDRLAEERSRELLELLGLSDDGGTLVADYSHGMKKKLSLALAFLSAPRLLFLDEPFEGIDAVSSRQVKRLLQDFAGRGGTVFLTSHVLEIVERLADHVGIIHRGRLVAQGPIEDLRSDAVEGSSLEEIFLALVGAGDRPERSLEWLGG
ncbi:MAG: ABC transporter ATP-binding protein [Acidobacteriota bacterium]